MRHVATALRSRVADVWFARRCLLLLVALPAVCPAGPMHGQHFPHGRDAVDYLYGPLGMWRDQTGLAYTWNYYTHCESASHQYNRAAMLVESATQNSTSPDAQCLMLSDLNNDREIRDDIPTGFAFHEHAGRGANGELIAPPFYQFWFDDNWLARYVSIAYGRPHPIGLHDRQYGIRWRIIGGDNRYWTPYLESSQLIDRIALNGLFKLNADDFRGALADWHTIKSLSAWTYNSTNRRYEYTFSPNETYHVALWAILSEHLLARRASFAERDDVLQHAVSLRSILLDLQERDATGTRLGWKTGIDNPQSLINTETTSLVVLALGAHASWVFEPGYAPLHSANGNYSQRSHDALSAVAGQSAPGHIVFGPYITLPAGVYDVDFELRTPSNAGSGLLATLDVYDGERVVAIMDVNAAATPGSNEWQRYRLTANVGRSTNSTEFRVYWHGHFDLDVGSVRVTQR